MGCAVSKDDTAVSDDQTGAGKNAAEKAAGFAKSFTDLEDLFAAGERSEYVPTGGPLTAKEYKARLAASETQSVTFPITGVTMRYATVTQRGYYPDAPTKANQDANCTHARFGGESEQAFFAVFDGHGEYGTQCAQFARDKVPENLLSNPQFLVSPEVAYLRAMVQTNAQLHSQADIDDAMSGTTAITVLVRGRTLFVANVGDSRCVLAEKEGDKLIAQDLSFDQTPFRRDECERVKRCGARVLTLDQLEGLKDPNVEFWGTEEDNDGDPPRLWAHNATSPGTAFTRSIGDSNAERIGVCAEPEVVVKQLSSSHPFMVIASDGVWEFLTSQSVVDMVSKFDDPHEACLSVVAESYRLWLQHETRTDDITMMVVHFSGIKEEAPKVALPTPLGANLDFSTRPMPLSMSSANFTRRIRASWQLPAIESPPSDHGSQALNANHTSSATRFSIPGASAGSGGSGRLATQKSRRERPGSVGTAGGGAGVGGGGTPMSGAGIEGASGAFVRQLSNLSVESGPGVGMPGWVAARLSEGEERAVAVAGPSGVGAGSVEGVGTGPGGVRSSVEAGLGLPRLIPMPGGASGGGTAGAGSTAAFRRQYSGMEPGIGAPPPPSVSSGRQRATSPSGGPPADAQPHQPSGVLLPLPPSSLRSSDTNHNESPAVLGPSSLGYLPLLEAVSLAYASAPGFVPLLGSQSRRPASAERPTAATLSALLPPSDAPDSQRLQFLDAAVRSHFLFSWLGPTQRRGVLALFERRTVQPGEVVLYQGEQGDHFYVVESGEFEVWVQGPPGAGGPWGAAALGGAHGPPPPAALAQPVSSPAAAAPPVQRGKSQSGPAAQKGVASRGVSPSPSMALLTQAPPPGPSYTLVHTYSTGTRTASADSGGGGGTDEAGAVAASMFGALALMYAKPRAASIVARTGGTLWALARAPFRHALQHLEPEPAAGAALVAAVAAAEPQPPVASTVTGPSASSSSAPVTAFSTAVRPRVPHSQLRGVAQSMRSVAALQCMDMGMLYRLASVMEQVVYRDGEYVIRQGEEGSDFFLLQAGEVICTVRKNPEDLSEAPKEVGLHLSAGQYFGERALLVAAPRAANVVAQGPVTAYCLSRSQLEAVVGGTLQAVKDAEAQWKESLALQREFLARKNTATGKLVQGNFSLDDLVARGLLFSTDCAALMLMEHKDSEGIFTVRVTSVADVVALGKQALVLRAREITRNLEPSFFVPGVLKSFKDSRVVAEVLMTVGICTLGMLLVPQPLDEVSAAFVAAGVVLGLEHLHWSRVIHRGLSVHTVIVTEEGQVQLVDMRFARRNDGRAYTLCGNPEYLAPEIVLGRPYNEAVDLWALGVLIYCMLSGETPFSAAGDDELRMYRNIASHGGGTSSSPNLPLASSPSAPSSAPPPTAGPSRLAMPPHVSPMAGDLISRLLDPDPDRRLGAGPLGLSALKAHPWFQAIPWAALLEHRCPPPPGVRERMYNFEGLAHAHFDPRPCEADTLWINGF